MVVSHPMPEKDSKDNQSKLNKRLALYSLAAGAAVAGAGTQSADAAVAYSGPYNGAIPQFSATNLNLDGDAYNDVLLKNYVFLGGNYQGAYVNFGPGKVVGFFSGFGYVSALSVGDVVDAATTSGGPFQASLAYGTNNPNAEFNNAVGAFIGVAFPINAVNHYGWIRVNIDNAAGTFTIVDWAYEDQPGVGITIPEPGALGLLAAGSVGLAGLRRRRSA